MDRFSQVLNLKNLKRSEQAKVSRESTDEGDLLSMIRRGTLVDFSSMFTAYERQVIQIGAKNDNCIEHIDSSAKTEAVRSLVIIDCKSGRDILFIFGDSFMSYNWIQLFPHHFRRTIFSTNISSFDSLVKKYGKPDIILHERVERGVRFLKLK